MPEKPDTLTAAARRLCSEIQLFDLCDLERCDFRTDRFCSNKELTDKFESIKEEEDSPTIYDEDELEGDGDESDFDEFDDDYDGEDE